MTISELAKQLSLSEEAVRRLLDAGVALRLLERRRNRRYALGPLGAPLVANPGIAAMIDHHTALYDDLRDPVALLRDEFATNLRGYWPYAGDVDYADLKHHQVAAYSELMAVSQPLIADDVLAAYPVDRHHTLLDIGGGQGGFLAAVAAQAPNLRLTLFDLPPVVIRAQTYLERAGLADRIAVTGGDFTRDPLPTGADLVSLIRIVHDHDDDTVLRLLTAAKTAIEPGGTLLLAEPMSATRGAEPVADAYFAFYLRAMGRGRPRTPARIKELLKAAGFTNPKLIRTRRPLLTRLIVANRPKCQSSTVNLD